MTDEEYAQWYARTGGRIRPVGDASACYVTRGRKWQNFQWVLWRGKEAILKMLDTTEDAP
ncbi:hypothetical protein IRY61_02565 [Candidatus Saccharibacteria bacterium]|nr:hypothetical protein [Candidatus Saccharibacteria bacterium]